MIIYRVYIRLVYAVLLVLCVWHTATIVPVYAQTKDNLKLLTGRVWVHKYRFVDGQYEVSPHINQRMQFNENGTYFFSWNNTRGFALNRWRFEGGQSKIVIKSMYDTGSKYITCDIVQLTPEYLKLRWKEGTTIVEDVLFSIRTRMRSFR
jgi:hypothetical protein